MLKPNSQYFQRTDMPHTREIRDTVPAVSLVPPQIKLTDMLAKTEEAGQAFRSSLQHRGYALIDMDLPKVVLSCAEYSEIALRYLEQKQEGKNGNIDPDKNNLGYVKISDVREYIKLRPEDPESLWPQNNHNFTEAEQFKDAYQRFFACYCHFAVTAFELLAEAPAIDRRTKKQGRLISEEARDAIIPFLKHKSSVSAILYHSVDKFSEVCDEHTDTGVLTFITKTAVPSLEMWDRTLNCYVKVEELAKDGDVIIFMGEKVPLFSNSDTFKATPHRVRMPAGTNRLSVAFLLDCAK